MISKIFRPVINFYQPDPPIAESHDPEEIRKNYLHWRWRMFIGFFLGYCILYFCRKNISNAFPVMSSELGYSNVQLGVIGTTLYVTYGIGKFLNGILADNSNIRRFMATGLIISGIVNIFFGFAGSLWVLALCWGLNGWFQSMGFPPIARGMTLWYEAKGKATRWAFWTCSHQLGTALIMMITAWILTWGTWRYCFQLPGILCIVFGVVLLFLLGDTPKSLGLPTAKALGDAEIDEEDESKESYREAFIKYVLLNRNVWVVGLIDLCVYVIRYGTLDWTTKFMVGSKGYELSIAGYRAGLMPLAGIIGVLASGYISDVLFRSHYKMVNAVSLVMLGISMYGFLKIGVGHPMLDILFLLSIGFFVEGPQSILGGVGAVDAGGSARVASSAAGLVGVLAYFGASLSGVGTGWAIDNYGWQGAYGFWIGCSVVGFILCAFFWHEKKNVSVK